MKIQQIFHNNTLRNFSYLITFSDGYIVCIDPYSSQEVISALAGNSIDAIVNTHDHCDHYSGNQELVKHSSCKVLAHTSAQIPLKSQNLKDREIVYRFGDEILECWYTPGHTMTHIALALKRSDRVIGLFTGDCFFNAGVGNCHNGGDPKVLFDTIQRVFKTLSDDVLIYPGHDYLKRNLEFTLSIEKNNQVAQNFLNKILNLDLDKTFFINTMGTEKEINTFLRLDSPDIQSQFLTSNHQEKLSDEETFVKLRQLRNKW